MKEELLKIKLPQKYKEGLINYKEGLDNIPDWPELSEKGYTWDEHLKLNKLIEIEHMKHSLNDLLEDDELTEEEIQEARILIQKSIKEYNEM